mmetsp:Transcript_18165/g.22881  ORF Transcript_18165/g.22881 Transcript_18165/m.22881 type:complete len:160 (+) Transcript_18165:279-758(+)
MMRTNLVLFLLFQWFILADAKKMMMRTAASRMIRASIKHARNAGTRLKDAGTRWKDAANDFLKANPAAMHLIAMAQGAYLYDTVHVRMRRRDIYQENKELSQKLDVYEKNKELRQKLVQIQHEALKLLKEKMELEEKYEELRNEKGDHIGGEKLKGLRR